MFFSPRKLSEFKARLALRKAAREGEIPHRGSRATKISRVIPVVLSPTVFPSGGEELESFREEDDISCTYALQRS